MGTFQNYRDLLVWKKSMELVVQVYRETKRLPAEERFGLVSQLRRAAVSIPSNIAEGHSRNSTKEFIQFLGIAKGSLAELETQFELATRLDWISADRQDELMIRTQEIGRMLHGLTSSLKSLKKQ